MFGTGIVPRAVSEGHQAKVISATRSRFDMIHDVTVKDATVRVDKRLVKAVDENARRRWLHANLRIDDAIITSEGYKDITCLRRVTRMYPNASKEITPRVCKPEDEKCRRCGQRDVDAVFDGRENGDKNCSPPDEKFEWRNAPELVHLGGLGDEIGHGVDNDSGEPSRWNPEEGWSETI